MASLPDEAGKKVWGGGAWGWWGGGGVGGVDPDHQLVGGSRVSTLSGGEGAAPAGGQRDTVRWRPGGRRRCLPAAAAGGSAPRIGYGGVLICPQRDREARRRPRGDRPGWAPPRALLSPRVKELKGGAGRRAVGREGRRRRRPPRRWWATMTLLARTWAPPIGRSLRAANSRTSSAPTRQLKRTSCPTAQADAEHAKNKKKQYIVPVSYVAVASWRPTGATHETPTMRQQPSPAGRSTLPTASRPQPTAGRLPSPANRQPSSTAESSPSPSATVELACRAPDEERGGDGR